MLCYCINIKKPPEVGDRELGCIKAPGPARLGWRGSARLVGARLGSAWLGAASRGLVRRGSARLTRLGATRLTSARLDAAGRINISYKKRLSRLSSSKSGTSKSEFTNRICDSRG